MHVPFRFTFINVILYKREQPLLINFKSFTEKHVCAKCIDVLALEMQSFCSAGRVELFDMICFSILNFIETEVCIILCTFLCICGTVVK